MGGVWRSQRAIAMWPLVIVALVGFSVFFALAVASGEPQITVVMGLILAYLVHSFGWRDAYELRVEPGFLVWRAPLATGRVALEDLVRFRSALLARDFIILKCRANRNVRVWKGPGLRAFLEAEVFGPPSDRGSE